MHGTSELQTWQTLTHWQFEICCRPYTLLKIIGRLTMEFKFMNVFSTLRQGLPRGVSSIGNPRQPLTAFNWNSIRACRVVHHKYWYTRGFWYATLALSRWTDKQKLPNPSSPCYWVYKNLVHPIEWTLTCNQSLWPFLTTWQQLDCLIFSMGKWRKLGICMTDKKTIPFYTLFVNVSY